MSLEAITWAFRQSLTPSEKLVLLTLADYADDENKCWPKQETLATRTGLKRPTIALKMKLLESAGLLTRMKRQYSSDMTFLNVDVTATTNEKPKTQNKTRTPRVFQPPTLADVQTYAKAIGIESQADQFHEYFTVGNWKDSRGAAVKNWKQKLLTWKSFNNEKRGRNSRRNTGTFAGKSDYGAAAVKAGGA